MAKKRKKVSYNFGYYKLSKMDDYRRNCEIRKVLSGAYDNWKSFGYSGGTCSGK